MAQLTLSMAQLKVSRAKQELSICALFTSYPSSNVNVWSDKVTQICPRMLKHASQPTLPFPTLQKDMLQSHMPFWFIFLPILSTTGEGNFSKPVEPPFYLLNFPVYSYNLQHCCCKLSKFHFISSSKLACS